MASFLRKLAPSFVGSSPTEGETLKNAPPKHLFVPFVLTDSRGRLSLQNVRRTSAQNRKISCISCRGGYYPPVLQTNGTNKRYIGAPHIVINCRDSASRSAMLRPRMFHSCRLSVKTNGKSHSHGGTPLKALPRWGSSRRRRVRVFAENLPSEARGVGSRFAAC